MISANNVTWTDNVETLAITEELKKKYAGSEIEVPKCFYCKRITDYVVENFPFRAGVRFILGLMKPTSYGHNGKLYIPATVCFKCNASYEGAISASQNLEVRNLDELALAEEEKHLWFEGFHAAKFKTESKISEEKEVKTKKRNKYL